MCAICDGDGAYQICEACRRYTGEGFFPLDRESFTFGAALGIAWSRFKRQWPMLCVAVVILLGIGFTLQSVKQVLFLPFAFLMEDGTSPVAVMVFLMALMGGLMVIEIGVTAVLNVGVLRVALDVLMGRPVSFSRLFGQYRKAGAVLLQALAAMLALGVPAFIWMFGIVMVPVLSYPAYEGYSLILVGALVFLVGLGPFTYWALPFFFMQTELALGKSTGPIESIRNAARVIRGRRWPALGAVVLLLVLSTLGVLLCCIGLIPALALGQLVLASVYLGLRNGSEVTSPVQELSD